MTLVWRRHSLTTLEASLMIIILNLRLVVSWNVIRKISRENAKCGNNVINNILIDVLINITWLPQMFLSNGWFYCQCYPLFSAMPCLSHTLSLCLSAILLSSLLSMFDIKTLSTIFSSSINKRILHRTVLISKVAPTRNHNIFLLQAKDLQWRKVKKISNIYSRQEKYVCRGKWRTPYNYLSNRKF